MTRECIYESIALHISVTQLIHKRYDCENSSLNLKPMRKRMIIIDLVDLMRRENLNFEIVLWSSFSIIWN